MIAQFLGAPVGTQAAQQRLPRLGVPATNADPPSTKVKRHNRDCGNLEQRKHHQSSLDRLTASLGYFQAPRLVLTVPTTCSRRHPDCGWESANFALPLRQIVPTY